MELAFFKCLVTLECALIFVGACPQQKPLLAELGAPLGEALAFWAGAPGHWQMLLPGCYSYCQLQADTPSCRLASGGR